MTNREKYRSFRSRWESPEDEPPDYDEEEDAPADEKAEPDTDDEE